MLWWLKLIQTLRLFIFTIPSSSLDFPAQHVPHTHYRALCKQRLICQQNVSGSYLRGSVTGSWNTRAAGDAAWFGGCPRSLENHYNFSISTLFRGMRSVGEKEAGGSKEVSASCWISCLGFWVHESLHGNVSRAWVWTRCWGVGVMAGYPTISSIGPPGISLFTAEAASIITNTKWSYFH